MDDNKYLKNAVDEVQAAYYLGLSRQYLRNARWRGTGGPKYVKIGAAVRYRIRDLDEFLEDRLVT